MNEPRIVVSHREHLWWLLAEAAQLEHMIMCQYLFAEFSLKNGTSDGLTAEQDEAVTRWRETLYNIAEQQPSRAVCWERRDGLSVLRSAELKQVS